MRKAGPVAASFAPPNPHPLPNKLSLYRETERGDAAEREWIKGNRSALVPVMDADRSVEALKTKLVEIVGHS